MMASRREGGRPEELKIEKLIEHQTAVVLRAMDTLENDLENLQAEFAIGQIAIACSIGWLDFRFSDLGWRGERPGLADWFEGVSERPSKMKTVPS